MHRQRPHGRRPGDRDRGRDRDRQDDLTEDPERLSRFLALVLRHRAYQFDLDMDDEGYVDLERLLAIMKDQRGLAWVERKHVDTLLEGQERMRFELRDGSIRATYGHSFRKPIHYVPIEPPEHLFIGVPRGKMSDVRTGGLQPTGRQYVHLSADKDEAMTVGKQHDPSPVVITVNALEAHRAGIQFHKPIDGIYLAARIPADHVQLEIQYGRKIKKGSRRP